LSITWSVLLIDTGDGSCWITFEKLQSKDVTRSNSQKLKNEQSKQTCLNNFLTTHFFKKGINFPPFFQLRAKSFLLYLPYRTALTLVYQLAK